MGEVVPMVNQIEVHPFFFPRDVIDFCKSKNIAIEAYAPLGGGPHSNTARDSRGEINGTDLLLNHKAIVDIATEMGCSAGQVVLRWGIENGFIILPQSNNLARITENAAIFDIKLRQ